MTNPTSPARRPRTRWLAAATAVLAALAIGLALLGPAPSRSARPIGVAGRTEPARPTDLVTPEEAARRVRPPVEDGDAASRGDSLGAVRPAANDPARAAWELVARLEALARAPRTFHAEALPVVELLGAVCAREEARAADVAGELRRLVVDDDGHAALVRGAVLLALAPVQPESATWGTISEWLSGAPHVPLELVRTAALTASRVGEPSPCGDPLPLAKLADLPTLDAIELPRFYPLALDRIASGRVCDALRRWLDLDDPRKRRFRLTAAPPDGGAELADLADYAVTCEVVYGVWGHRSLIDTQIERAVLGDARSSLADLLERDLVHLRAAHFLVLALARCNAAFMDAAVALTADSGGPELSFAEDLRGLLAEELGPVTIERLERLRYSERPIDDAELTLALADLRDGFERAETHDVEQRAVLLDYLCGLVADSGLSWTVRLGAVEAVASGGSWEAMRVAAAAAFQPGAPLILSQMTLPHLRAAAGSSPERRAEAVVLLQQFAAQSPANAAQLGIDSYIEQFKQ